MRLIDADKLIQFVENWGKLHGREEAADSLLYAIRNASAVDAVEVVRCRDCVHFSKRLAIGTCKRIPDKPIIPMRWDNYCMFGERREENAAD